MKKSKKNSLAAAGMILVLLLAGVIFFFTYYQVDEVQVMGSSHYSEKQIKKMVTSGAAGIQFCSGTPSLHQTEYKRCSFCGWLYSDQT